MAEEKDLKKQEDDVKAKDATVEETSEETVEETSEKTDNSKEEKPKSSTKKVNKKHENHKWYVLNIRSGYENSVAEAIKQRVEATELGDMISDVLVPVHKKIVVKKGKQEIKEEKLFPGYVLVKMDLNENTWTLIQNTEGVRGFVKTDKYPRPLPENQVEGIMKFMEVEQPAYEASYSIGEAVKIVDGPFADFIGSVKSLDESKGKVEVMISFLGREAPVELDFSQVSKL